MLDQAVEFMTTFEDNEDLRVAVFPDLFAYGLRQCARYSEESYAQMPLACDSTALIVLAIERRSQQWIASKKPEWKLILLP